MNDNDKRRLNGRTQPGRKITDEQILDGISAGLTRQEIADLYGVHVENLARRMRKLGVHATYAPNNGGRKIYGDCWHFVENQKVKFEKQHPKFEYLETRKAGATVRVRMKCRICGAVVERCASTLRRNNIECEFCKEEKKLIESRVDLINTLGSIKLKQCHNCGAFFYSIHKDKAYCSEKCKRSAKRKRNKIHKKENGTYHRDASKYRTRCRKYGGIYDSSVTRVKVVARDKNICQICGKICDETDTRWGSFGPDFPTLDHIVALANGGNHTWDNVQCACGECNCNKGILSMSEVC